MERNFYRAYDIQTGCYLATGYNAQSEFDLCQEFREYLKMDRDAVDAAIMTANIESLEYYLDLKIDTSPTPFEEIDNF